MIKKGTKSASERFVSVRYEATSLSFAKNETTHSRAYVRAGQQVDDYLLRHANDCEWPTPSEVRHLISRVRESEQEARQIISELRDLGADAGLFKLNGD